MKDFFGQDLQVEDDVAVLLKGYRELTRAVVKKMTPKGCKVEYVDPDTKSLEHYQVVSNMLVKKPEN